jgi:hypothetical protein
LKVINANRRKEMIGFEVEINGEKVCIAGFETPGVLTAALSWVKARPSNEGTNSEAITFHVGGLTDRGSERDEFIDWIRQSLSLGDEVKIRVLEAEEFDQPVRTYTRDASESVERARQYYEQLKTEAEGKPRDI